MRRTRLAVYRLPSALPPYLYQLLDDVGGARLGAAVHNGHLRTWRKREADSRNKAEHGVHSDKKGMQSMEGTGTHMSASAARAPHPSRQRAVAVRHAARGPLPRHPPVPHPPPRAGAQPPPARPDALEAVLEQRALAAALGATTRKGSRVLSQGARMSRFWVTSAAGG